MKTCKHCNKEFSGPHQCEVANRQIEESDEGDFLTSMVVGAITDNAIIGALVGYAVKALLNIFEVDKKISKLKERLKKWDKDISKHLKK